MTWVTWLLTAGAGMSFGHAVLTELEDENTLLRAAVRKLRRADPG